MEQYKWHLREEEGEVEVEPSPPNETNNAKEQGLVVRKLDGVIQRIAIFSSFLEQLRLCYFKVKLSLYQLPGPYLQFYSFLNIFTALENIAIRWRALSNFRTTGPRALKGKK